MKQPRCSECKAEISIPLTDVIPGADWLCLECSGASLSDFDMEECGTCGDLRRISDNGHVEECQNYGDPDYKA